MAKKSIVRNSSRQYWAEALGTFGLVFGGVGALVLNNPATGLGAPPAAVSIGMAIAKRFAWKEVVPYIAAQVIGGAIAAFIIYLIVTNRAGGYTGTTSFVSNGPGSGYGIPLVLAVEILVTFMFMLVIL